MLCFTLFFLFSPLCALLSLLNRVALWVDVLRLHGWRNFRGSMKTARFLHRALCIAEEKFLSAAIEADKEHRSIEKALSLPFVRERADEHVAMYSLYNTVHPIAARVYAWRSYIELKYVRRFE